MKAKYAFILITVAGILGAITAHGQIRPCVWPNTCIQGAR